MWDRVQDDKLLCMAFELQEIELKRLKFETIPNLLSVNIVASWVQEQIISINCIFTYCIAYQVSW